jgi:hypothetical protein
MLKEDFSNIVRSNYCEMLLQGFRCLNVQICINGFTTWHNIYQNHLLCIPNNMAKTFPAEGVALKFSPGVAG